MDEEVIDPDFSKITEGTIFKKTLGDMEDKTVAENIEIIGMMVTIEAGIDQEKSHFQESIAIIGIEVPSNSRSRSGSRASTNKDRIRCYNCREYDHFARDCPTSREERDLEQLQQMLNLEGQTYLLTCSQDSPTGNYRMSPLNL